MGKKNGTRGIACPLIAVSSTLSRARFDPPPQCSDPACQGQREIVERSWLFNPELPDGFAARVTANNVVNLRCTGCGAVTVPVGVTLELLQLAADEFLALGFHRFADACERERKRLESLESDDVSDRVRHFSPVPARVW